jgi:hypothetical protein
VNKEEYLKENSSNYSRTARGPRPTLAYFYAETDLKIVNIVTSLKPAMTSADRFVRRLPHLCILVVPELLENPASRYSVFRSNQAIPCFG